MKCAQYLIWTPAQTDHWSKLAKIILVSRLVNPTCLWLMLFLLLLLMLLLLLLLVMLLMLMMLLLMKMLLRGSVDLSLRFNGPSWWRTHGDVSGRRNSSHRLGCIGGRQIVRRSECETDGSKLFFWILVNERCALHKYISVMVCLGLARFFYLY